MLDKYSTPETNDCFYDSGLVKSLCSLARVGGLGEEAKGSFDYIYFKLRQRGNVLFTITSLLNRLKNLCATRRCRHDMSYTCVKLPVYLSGDGGRFA